jgi:hypothetical protein
MCVYIHVLTDRCCNWKGAADKSCSFWLSRVPPESVHRQYKVHGPFHLALPDKSFGLFVSGFFLFFFFFLFASRFSGYIFLMSFLPSHTHTYKHTYTRSPIVLVLYIFVCICSDGIRFSNAHLLAHASASPQFFSCTHVRWNSHLKPLQLQRFFFFTNTDISIVIMRIYIVLLFLLFFTVCIIAVFIFIFYLLLFIIRPDLHPDSFTWFVRSL